MCIVLFLLKNSNVNKAYSLYSVNRKLYFLIVIFYTFVCSLKTSFLKWRPDYEIASDEYNKAGKVKQL